MIIAADVYYAAGRAKTAGVLFRSWDDAEPLAIIAAYTDNPQEYEPGNFYKRELPCIRNLLAQVDPDSLDAIIIDGYVYLSGDKKPGLGMYVCQSYDEKIPVAGVAKNAFHGSDTFAARIYRGGSSRPLFVTCAGMELSAAAGYVLSMHGAFRFPHLLKLLDTHTKTGWEVPVRE